MIQFLKDIAVGARDVFWLLIDEATYHFEEKLQEILDRR